MGVWVKAELIATEYEVRFLGVDAAEKRFDVCLDHETARRLIFKLHAIILEHERMARAVKVKVA